MRHVLLRSIAFIIVTFSLVLFARGGGVERNRGVPRYAVPSYRELLRRPLSLLEAVNIAVAQNAVIRAAQKEVEARYGVAIQVRAIVLPKLVESASYVYHSDSLIERTEVPSFRLLIPQLGIDRTIGGGLGPLTNNQVWNNDIRVIQSVYEGGRLMSALRQTKLIREQALLDFQTAVSDVLLQVRVTYDDAQLAAGQIKLREQEVALLESILDKVSEQAKVGVVSDFAKVRAEVEINNARSPLATARQDFVIAKQHLLQLMGYDVPIPSANDVTLDLSTPLQALKYEQDLPAALVTAARQRSELASIYLVGKLADEAIIVAKAGNKPSIQAFAAYDAFSRVQSRDPGDPLNGGLVGGQVTWPIFDGFLTRGRVMEAVAKRGQVAHNTDELSRQITLQVRTAWARLVEQRNIVDIQSSNVDAGVRTVDLAQTRYFTGIGSEVELLDAQRALTDARIFYVAALRDYSVAYSEMLRATGEDLRWRR
jgi:outer membrane protein TolC